MQQINPIPADPSPSPVQALGRFIAQHGIAAEIVPVAVETPTVPAAAAALGVSPAQIIKSLLFLVRDQPVLVIASGDRLVDRGILAARFGVGKKQVKLADAGTVLRLTGYPAGGVPPFGHPAPLLTLLDRAVLAWDAVYGGGGDDRTLLRVAPGELARATGAEWIELSRSPTPSTSEFT
jgi:prolyl-tRNA editing enzyme YbaK/EbsC (Cys-tRNA(Pro) deacylase)